MQKYLISVMALLAVSAFVLMAADIDGKWSATTEGFKGPQTTKLTLKSDGAKLTGEIDNGRGAVAISDGKIDGKAVSFKATREGKQGAVTTEYKGSLTSATELKLTPEGGAGGKGGGKGPTEMTFKKE